MQTPPERDLQAGVGDAFGGEGFAPLLRDHFAFYLMRRYFEDLAARVELLYGMEAFGFAPWPNHDATLADIAAALVEDDAPTAR